MAGEKRFRNSFFGFKKSDVNAYIEKILKEFDDKLKEKDDEITALKNQNREAKLKFEDLSKKADQINEDRAKIADVLIKAQEKAELIIEDARLQAIDEKKKLEQMVEEEKEKLVDLKQELKLLKSEVINTLKKYEGQLTEMIDTESAS
ncbi:MAG: DivIVA domain-containing protein [Clostridia bacterium]|nr:DivIVA domain-containing protein [Clostridia bacterium]